MDHNEKSPSPKSFTNEHTHADDLLEENWFFGNLLDKKTTNTKNMLRSNSDPSPTSMENEKLSQTKRHSLVRAPSLPPSLGREKRGEERETGSGSKGNSGLRKPRMSLNRALSLPPCMGREEDVESEFSLSRLIRQASLSSSDELPPKHNTKGIKQCSSALRYRPQAKSLPENNETGAFNEMRNQSIKVQNKLRKSMSDVKLQQAEEIKDTYYKFDKKYINPIVMPCFQEKPIIGYGESLSAEDMKAQIKYWARSVAANVR